MKGASCFVGSRVGLLGVFASAGLLTGGCVGSGSNAQGTGGSSGSGGSGVSGGTGSGSGGSNLAGVGGTPGTGAGGQISGAGGSGGAGPGSGGSAGMSGGAGAGAGGSAGTSGGGSSGSGPVVHLDQAHQTMQGFGINDSWHPAYTDAQADQLFSTTAGIGLSILRIGMGSDGNAISANIASDVTKAKARGVSTIIGSCWSPPANCKTNNNVNDGGHLLTSCYDSWSTTIANFARTNGLYAMSLANEPDFASCGAVEPCNGNYPTTLYTANEMVAFAKIAAPKLKAAGVKVLAPEPSEWIHLWSNQSATGSVPSNKNSSDPLNCGFPPSNAACTTGGGYDYGHYLAKDATAWAGIDIVGVHQYDTQVAQPWPSDVPQTKPIWETEMSGVKWWPEQGPSSDINDGIVVAGWIHDAIVNGPASAWLWWWYQAQGTNDNEGLVLQNGTVAKRLYTLGNFSKFIRPGYTRVDVAGTVPAGVLLTAYKGTDGTVVIVAVNKNTAATTLAIAIAGATAPTSLTPWVTSATDNLVSKAAVAVGGGSFTATLAATTVTTFVGK